MRRAHFNQGALDAPFTSPAAHYGRGNLLFCLALTGCPPAQNAVPPQPTLPTGPSAPAAAGPPAGQIDPAANVPAGNARFRVTDLGAGVEPDGINASGQIVAHTEDGASPSLDHAVLIENGKSTPLGDLPGCNSTVATAINDRGQVVGTSSQGNTGEHPFLWQKGQFTPLPIVPGTKGTFNPWAINQKGQILGTMYPDYTSVQEYAMVWSDPAQPPKRLALEHGCDINDAGAVVGTLPWDIGGSEKAHEFYRLDPGSDHPVDLGFHAQKIETMEIPLEYSRINDSGTIVCTSYVDMLNCPIYLLPRGGKPVQIVKDGLPFGMNAKGQVVGLSGSHDLTYLPGHPEYGVALIAFLYDSSGFHELDKEIAPNSGWHLEYATAISSNGRIVGIGSFHNAAHGFLLTPK